jgi:hypothetical protein
MRLTAIVRHCRPMQTFGQCSALAEHARIVCDTDARISAYKMGGEIMTTWRENGGGMAR